MYCPACGSETSDSQKFCRACGMDVKTVQAAVAEHLSQRDPKSALAGDINRSENRRKELERRGTIVMLSGVSLMVFLVVGFLIAIGLSRVVDIDINSLGIIAPWIIAVGLILMVTGIGIGVYPRLAKEPSRSTPDSLMEPTPKLITDSSIESLPSITEHTTRKLETVSRPKKRITAETGP
jgi:hypothetical protein